MKIKVRIEIEVEGAVDHYPAKLAWTHGLVAGDNPNYYGHEVQRALEAAFVDATKGVQPYVRYRDNGGPEDPNVRRVPEEKK